MPDSDTATEPAEVGADVAEPDFDHLAGIVTDGLIGAVGGLVGTAAMTVGLFIAASLDAFAMQAFALLAELTGLGAVVPLTPSRWGTSSSSPAAW
ncbi:MAG: DUF6789 family protein [Halorientalis sp.]